MSDEKALVIADVEIVQDANGRYSLNTLHRASGGKGGKRPSIWLENEATQELVKEFNSQSNLDGLDVVKGGNRGGTYAHELLAVSYAGWISPAFQLKVNQAFLMMKRNPSSALDRYPELKAITELALGLAEARDIATQAQAEAHAARTQAAVADAKVEALADTQRMTVEHFILANGLLQKFPYEDHRRVSDWLADFCLQYAWEVSKVPVYGKPWAEEKAFPMPAFSAWMRHEVTRFKQQSLRVLRAKP